MFRFKLKKTIQAIAVLFREEHVERMPYIRLLKLLYVADRESLQETGRPITGDHVVAMDHGPVLSRTYDLIKGETVGTDVWSGFFRRCHYLLEIVAQPDVGELSRYEIEKLQSVAKRHEDDNDWHIVNQTHAFDEWKRNQPVSGSSRPIPFEDVLRAVGREKDLESIAKYQQDEQVYDRIFGDS